MRKLIGILCLVCAISCQEPLVDSLPRFMREQGRYSRGEPGDTSARPLPTPEDPPLPAYVPSVYATALHFRDSVNWRLDSLGAVDLLFFKDGELVQRLPVPSPPDPERHRIWQGHLWTDFTDGHETVLLCDGVERFRYPGEEHLQGFLIVDGDVHTLGQSPGNGGFCYRINGEAVFSRDKGSVLGSPSLWAWKGGALYLDGEEIYYSYKIGRDYHVMKGAETFRIIPAGSYDALYDLRVRDGHLWRAEKHADTPFLKCDDKEQPLRVSAYDMVSCRLIPSKDGVLMLGSSRAGGNSRIFWLGALGSSNISLRGTGLSGQSDLRYLDPNSLFLDVNTDGLIQKVLYNGEALAVPPGLFTCPSPLNLYLDEKHYAVALTHSSTGSHVILYDGNFTPLSFNGYFTSVLIQ